MLEFSIQDTWLLSFLSTFTCMTAGVAWWHGWGEIFSVASPQFYQQQLELMDGREAEKRVGNLSSMTLLV